MPEPTVGELFAIVQRLGETVQKGVDIQLAMSNGPRPGRRPPPTRMGANSADSKRSVDSKRSSVPARSAIVEGVSAKVDEDVLDLGVEIDRGHPELPPDARHLVAAERRLGVDR